MTNKKLYLFGEINDENIEKTVANLHDAIADTKVKTIDLILSSQGGFFYPALALFDTIRHSPKPVHIIATGKCMSSALMILQASPKRSATVNTIFMMHNLNASIERTSFNSYRAEAKNTEVENQKFISLTVEKSKVSIEEANKLVVVDYYFNAEEAFKMGFIDNIQK